ncbi:MAG: hypothetical protein M3N54_04350 [Acidobacteriota bacterium]|nr:hypothetical protein [Acidobacteriota bacterium]
MRRLLFFLSASCLAQVQPGQLYHGILATGQSLSTGCQGYASGQVTSGTPYSNLSLSPGTTLLEGTTVFQLDTAPLIPLAPTWTCNNNGGDSTDPSNLPQEYPSLSAVNQLTFLTGGAAGNRYILGQHGSSGREYAVIGGPTDVIQPSANPSFANGLVQLAGMKAAALAAGSTFQLDALILTHGETDEIHRNRTYDLDLNHFQWDYEQQSNALAGRTGLLPMFYSQQQSWGFYKGVGTVPTTAIAQWRAAENNPGRLFLTGPSYYLPTGAIADGVHKSPAGYRGLGELVGKAMFQVLVQHKAWVPLMPRTVTLSGATISAVFFVPVGSLQFDTATVPSQPNKGFEFTDGLTAWVDRIIQTSGPAPLSPVLVSGGSGYASPPTVSTGCGAYTANLTNGVVTSLTRTAAGSGCTIIDITFSAPTPSVSIASVSITAADTVQIVLSGPPTGPSPSLRYAYTALTGVGGGLGNLKDTDPTAGRTGSNLSDWCVTFDALIPFASRLLAVKASASTGVAVSSGVAQ